MLCGDVMPGRGIDQVLPTPCDPVLHEPHVTSALAYVALAERVNGPIPAPVPFAYVWGDALAELERREIELRIINLETAVTRSDRPEPKGINYRMSPENVGVLPAAGIDCCVLANNHILDWGVAGLLETIESLERCGIAIAGVGHDLPAARRPAVLQAHGGRRVLVYGLACRSSGVPAHWSAAPDRPGVGFLAELSTDSATAIGEAIARDRRPDDLVVVSIHWGGNWGYDVAGEQRSFARALVDTGAVDVVYGHSSHHPRAVEVHRDRPIFYGCGDFLNDYEGIGGYEAFRSELVLMYLPEFDDERRIVGLEMVPFRIERFRLERARGADAAWLQRLMDRECGRFGGRVRLDGDDALHLSWHPT